MDQRERAGLQETGPDYLARLNLEGSRGIWRGNRAKIDFIIRKTRRQLSPGMKVVEFGMGDGYLLERLARAGMQCTGLDISSYLISYHSDQMKSRGCAVRLLVADIADPEGYDLQSQDAVFCLDILEHIDAEEYRRAIRSIYNVLRPGGLLVGTLPYKEVLDDSMVRCPECGHVFHRVGHKQAFDTEKLRKSFETMFIIRRMGAVTTLNPPGMYRRVKRMLHGDLRGLGPGDTCYFIAERIS